MGSQPHKMASRAILKFLKFLTTMLTMMLAVSFVAFLRIKFRPWQILRDVDEYPCRIPSNFQALATTYSCFAILTSILTLLLVGAIKICIAWRFGSLGDKKDGEEALFASCTPLAILIRIGVVMAAAAYLGASVLTTTTVSYVIQIEQRRPLNCIESSIRRPLIALLALIHIANVILVVVVLSILVKNWRGHLADLTTFVRRFSTPVALIGGGISLTQLAAFVRRGSIQVETTQQQQGTTLADYTQVLSQVV